jgi:DNA-binding beta-propeller fold protein YncE
MFFEETGGKYELVYSDPLGLSDPIGGTWGANMVSTEGELVFAALSGGPLHLYQHCPGEVDRIRPLIEIEHPTAGSGLEFGDVAIYGDYLFVSEQYRPLLSEPTSALVHVYRWVNGPLATCPDQPSLLDPPEHLGSFASGLIPYRLLIDPAGERLYVGCTSKITFPQIDGDLLSYDLTAFNPQDVASFDAHRTSLAPDASMRVTLTNIHDLHLDGYDLYIIDIDNGLYLYNLAQSRVTAFYPAHRGSNSQAYTPSEWVQSPSGVVPLYHPVAMAVTPSGNIVVQEHVTGRVSIFSKLEAVFLPLFSGQ